MTNLRMYWDTETSGIIYNRDLNNTLKQPAIMSYAHVLVDDDWNEVEAFETKVKLPNYVEVERGAYNAHGLTREDCKEGITLKELVERFHGAISQSRMILGYHTDFDWDMMTVSYFRLRNDFFHEVPQIELPRKVDLMTYATPVCAIPPTERMRAVGRNHYKTPNLREAMSIICGVDHTAAHGALPDTRACVTLHRKLWELKNEKD